MAVLTDDIVRALAGFKGEDAPVVSCYLDVDGRRHVRQADVEAELDRLLRLHGDRLGDAASTRADVKKIVDHVRGGLDRSTTKGLALFSCAAHGFWRVVELAVPVRSTVVANHTPYVRPLEAIVEAYEAFGVVLVDKQRTRLFRFESGELTETTEAIEPLPRDDDGGAIIKDHFQHHVEELAHQHVRHAADAAFALFQAHPFAHLLVGATDEVHGELVRGLHPYLKERVAGRVDVSPGASIDDVRRAALAAEAEVERAKEAAAVAALRDAVGSGGKGVAGLEATLAAVVDRRVETLLVSAGYEAEGWRCDGCGHIAKVGRTCKACGAQMHHVVDVVEEAVEDALAAKARVLVCFADADLDVLGGVGALLRY